MPSVTIRTEVPKNFGDFTRQLDRLRARKQDALIRAIERNQRADRLSEDIQLRFGNRKINVKEAKDTARLVRRFGTRVFAQRWSAIGTSQPPLDRVVNEIMGMVLALAPRGIGEKTRTKRYRDSFRVYRRQSGETNLQHTRTPVGSNGWDSDTLFVIANMISYASTLEAREFLDRGTGIMYHAAQMAARKYPFVGVRFRYYQENRFPAGDYGTANSDLRQLRYYAVPVIEVGRASLVRKPSRRPGVRMGRTQLAERRAARRTARSNLRRARTR